ncbi:hypothetical protein J1605_015376 [Eschrichtius robustus]|uniref:Ig-like domain-containing protein n=1 Tax=Eschrichtius robustus TaxID=9764 RepID=A0AB34GBT9_ESCRO|nr:hypothetical protein J1605_015376 [Eschrichtius robustus]
MAWMALLLGLLTYGLGVDSQTVVQEPSVSVSSGGTISLTCGLSSGSVTTGYYPSWYQQTPGQAPKTVIYRTSSRPSGVPGRFSGSIIGNKAALTIRGAQPEDEADYYCSLYGAGSCSQPPLCPLTATTSPGQTATLSCPGNSNNVGSEGAACAATPWLGPQTPDPQESQPSPRASGRSLGSRSGGGASLSISGLQAEAEADYSCSAWDGSLAPHPVLHARGLGGTGPGDQVSVPSLHQPLWLRLLESFLQLLPHLHAVSVSAGFLSQPVPTQPPSLSTSPGASARFTCTLSSGYSVGGYHIFWYQQKPGSSPRYLLRFRSDSDKHQGSGVPSRFSGSKGASANAGLLLIAGLQPEDEADYYCATVHSNTGTYTVLQTHRKVRLKAPLCPPPETVTAALPGPCLTQGDLLLSLLNFLRTTNLTLSYAFPPLKSETDPLL